MRVLVAGVCTALALTACGSSDDSSGQPDGTAGAPSTSAGPTSAEPTEGQPSGPGEEQPVQPIAVGDVDESAAESTGPPVTLTDVRIGAHEGFDRIVFELAGEGQAGWQVGFTGAPRSQGSGRPVDVPGHAVLGITLTNIALPGDAVPGARPWEGPDRLGADEGTVLDTLVVDTLFEGYYTFFAGLDQQRPFAVGQLSSPQRIVVDLLDEEPTSSTELSQRCESPAGFAISYPEGWAVNSGETVSACTRFAPESFSVPPATDARVGSVTASVETIPFDRIASSQAAQAEDRRETTVDGHRAVRIQRVSAGEGLYPPGIRMTSYVVELEPGDDGPRTLVVDTVGLPQFDYARNVRMLDRMIETVEIAG
ncbi:AMIN-like domain-containing (lipo)protein [Blastococcus sp. SYSU DS0617]